MIVSIKLSQTGRLLKLTAKAVPQTDLKLSLDCNPLKTEVASQNTSSAPAGSWMRVGIVDFTTANPEQ